MVHCTQESINSFARWSWNAAARLGLLALLSCGLVRFLRGWRQLNPDGAQYLSMGKKLLESGFTDGFNGYWAPLYGVLAAGGAATAEGLGGDRLFGVQVLNYILFCIASFCCAALAARLSEFAGLEPRSQAGAAVQLVMLACFGLITCRRDHVTLCTPDMAVASVLFLAGNMTLAFLADEFGRGRAILSGLIFGIGYWFKSILFLIWLVWLSVCAVVAIRRKNGIRNLLISCCVWLALALPLVLLTSRAAGVPTFGDNGRVVFLTYVNKYPHRFWDGKEREYKVPLQDIRLGSKFPRVFLFGEYFPEAADPIWYAPSFWYRSARPRISMQDLSNSIWGNLNELRSYTERNMVVFTGLALVGTIGTALVFRQKRLWILSSIALSSFALLLVHAEPRFFLAQTTVLVGCGSLVVLVGIGRLRGGMEVSSACLVFLSLLAFVSVFRNLPQRTVSTFSAECKALRRHGLSRGSRICAVGYLGPHAWYLGSRIVAEMPLEDYREVAARGKGMPPAAMDAFRSAGCDACVARLPSGIAYPFGWDDTGVAGLAVKQLTK